ncbi:MAG: hypothetical protein Q9157_004621 [Trypethelium eluteriae]
MLVGTVLICLALAWSGLAAIPSGAGKPPPYHPPPKVKECVVQPHPSGGDSAPAILDAFRMCGQDGKIAFLNETYHVNSVMTTTGLKNCEVEINGTLLWGTDINYWLNSSLPMGYQNQSTAWQFGGTNVHLHGHGYGTLNGNGQVWYDFNKGQSNYPRRPHQITFTGLYDSVIENMRFVQSQMWTMTVIHASNVLLQNIYVSSTSNDSASTDNTDGADTIYANNITFRNWDVTNGDDCISQKANSTNILMEDITCHGGTGIAIGSIGQYNGRFETIQNVTARRVHAIRTQYIAYIKTWTGVATGYPPNGGGGGLGFIQNLTFSELEAVNTSIPFGITQCTSYNGATPDCDTSKFNIRDVKFVHANGTLSAAANETVAQMQCSAAAPCPGIEVKDVAVTELVGGQKAYQYQCDSVEDPIGFNCTGPVPCDNHAFGGC